jgi:quinol monooxygenase YgiN
MSEPVAFISRFRIKAGERAAYGALAAEVTPRLQAEKPQTLAFLSYLGNEDLLTIIHVFADAGSMDRHIEGADQRSAVAMRLLIPLGWEVYGAVSDAALATLKGAAASAGVPLAVHGEFLAGFLRLQPAPRE